MGFIYLALLLGGIGCMLLLDHRFRLFFWHDPGAAVLVTAVGTALFIVWDLAGIASDVFLRGDSAVASGIVLAPELPLEEPVFLVFLVLCTMVVFTGSFRILTSRSAVPAGSPTPAGGTHRRDDDAGSPTPAGGTHRRDDDAGSPTPAAGTYRVGDA